MDVQENRSLASLISLAEKTAVVTGGARGIGYAICSRLLEAGASVVILDNDAVTGQAAVENLAGEGRHICFSECDITAEAQVKSSFSEIDRKYGGIYWSIMPAFIPGNRSWR